jgi:hypothetical protein
LTVLRWKLLLLLEIERDGMWHGACYLVSIARQDAYPNVGGMLMTHFVQRARAGGFSISGRGTI